jgi:hypothetical protein
MTTPYRYLLDQIEEETEAEAVVLIVFNGTRGSGVGVKINGGSTAEAFALVPEVAQTLHDAADRLLADAKEQQRTEGN